MTTWFKSVFLPSIFSRAGYEKSIWLTAKQATICADNMRPTVMVDYDEVGQPRTHRGCECKWEGRSVSVQLSSLNGCAIIRFGMTASEQEENRLDNLADSALDKLHRLQHIKTAGKEKKRNNSDKTVYECKVEALKKELAQWEEELAECLEYGDPQEEIDNCETMVKVTRTYLHYLTH